MTNEEYGSNVSRLESILLNERIGKVKVNGGATTLVLAGVDSRFGKAFADAARRVSPSLMAFTATNGAIMCLVFHKYHEPDDAWRILL